jgi:hypothetical protein
MMDRFLRVEADGSVTYLNLDRIISIEIHRDTRRATIIGDFADKSLIVEGPNYDELIEVLGHEV